MLNFQHKVCYSMSNFLQESLNLLKTIVENSINSTKISIIFIRINCFWLESCNMQFCLKVESTRNPIEFSTKLWMNFFKLLLIHCLKLKKSPQNLHFCFCWILLLSCCLPLPFIWRILLC